MVVDALTIQLFIWQRRIGDLEEWERVEWVIIMGNITLKHLAI